MFKYADILKSLNLRLKQFNVNNAKWKIKTVSENKKYQLTTEFYVQ